MKTKTTKLNAEQTKAAQDFIAELWRDVMKAQETRKAAAAK